MGEKALRALRRAGIRIAHGDHDKEHPGHQRCGTQRGAREEGIRHIERVRQAERKDFQNRPHGGPHEGGPLGTPQKHQ